MSTPKELRRTSSRRKGQRFRSNAEREAVKEKFLSSFKNNANIRVACTVAGIDRNTFYDWQEKDEAFSLAYKQAEAEANDAIRAAIWQRGVVGWREPAVSGGKLVHRPNGEEVTIPRYSDTLLLALARARMPAEFREKQQVEHSGSIDLNSAKETLWLKLQNMFPPESPQE